MFAALALGAWLGCGNNNTAGPTGGGGGLPTSWAKRGGGSTFDYGYGAATDTSGNVYVTGKFVGTADFGTETLTDAGSGDVFVAKYDKDGNFKWAVRAGGTGTDDGQAIDTDLAGNVYITGQFSGTATFGTIDLVSAGSQDIFVAKLDTAGTVLWAERAGGTSFESGLDLAADFLGNVVVTGYFRDSFMYGSTQLTSAGSGDIFVATYNPSGTVAWARQAGSTGNDLGMGAAFDASGRPVVAGSFEGTVQFGTNTLISVGSRDVFIATYAPSGDVVWAKRGGGADADVANALAADGSGNSYVTGYFVDSAVFEADTLTDAGGGGDLFLVGYDAAGNVVMAERAGGSDWEEGNAIDTDPSGNIVVAGKFRGTAVFGTTSLTNAGRDDIFVAKFSAAGAPLWAWGAGTTGDDRGHGVAVDRSGNVISTGTFGSTVQFGQTSLTAVGATDVFVFRVGPDGP
jgi:hypothetical protein